MRLVISISLGVILLYFVSLSAAQTNATDQAALIAFWKGLTNKGTLGWNTTATNGLCGQHGIIYVNQKVQAFQPNNWNLAGTISTEIALHAAVKNV